MEVDTNIDIIITCVSLFFTFLNSILLCFQHMKLFNSQCCSCCSCNVENQDVDPEQYLKIVSNTNTTSNTTPMNNTKLKN